MRRALTAALLGLAIGASSGVPAIAQDTPTGLTTALASVPDTLEVRQQLVSWIDYDALIGSREGAAHPASIAALLASLDADDPAARLWMAALNGAASGSGRLQRYLFTGGAKWPQTVGFDFTDVRSELAFGAPPEDGIVLRGTFDPDRIAAALAARDFTQTDADPFSLWCRSDGCDKGVVLDLVNVDPSDPFGGELGRRQPLAVSPDTLLSSAAIGTVDGMLAATTNAGPSLADDGDYAALAGALAGEGTLIQATLVPGTALLFDPAATVGVGASPTQIRERLQQLAAHFDAIPSASLLGIGDAATASEQVVTLALAYPTLAEAQAATAVLPGRLDTMTSVRTQRAWKEELADRGVATVDAHAVERADGQGALALLTFRAPLAGPEQDPATGLLTSSSMLYRLFVQMIQARDTLWLVPSLPPLS